ncbi:guanine deaminase [Jimgerdemannia flammicorona]|uniref:Guanine deaminase n=1 Tax=Jimgerdemannia flammicorona TaxID=994334 RepID=A0A433Q8H6_9FUNG|nr:guanine deaminase [Jimgerdemannia flammicorona]
MNNETLATVYHGIIIHSLDIGNLEFIRNGLLAVHPDGHIAFLERDVGQLVKEHLFIIFSYSQVVTLSKHQFLIPGFIDTHAHAPQYVYAGTGLDLPLLNWLSTYTFPRESAFSSPTYALDVYKRVISRFLRNGTTTCAWFATIHLEATKLLVDVIRANGQRAFVGKVNMDTCGPDYYVEKIDDSVKSTRDFIQYVLDSEPDTSKSSNSSNTAKPTRLVTPIITPRFAVSCTAPLLDSLSTLASEHDLPIQSHLSENPSECELVQSLFPHCRDYTSVYDHYKLLTPRTIMAHGIHLSSEEIAILRDRGTGISHCPNSNFALQSGVCDVRRLLNAGVKVGLGTDVAGGYAPSILDAVRQAMTASKACKIQYLARAEERVERDPDYNVLTIPEVFYLATMGGAKLLNLEDVVGNFVPGKEFDALLVDVGVADGPIDVFDHDTTESLFEKFLYLGDERSLRAVWVKGRRVAGSSNSDEF